MIYPTVRSVVLTGLGAPAALIIGVIVPQFWYVGLVWVALMVALTILDALLAKPASRLRIAVERPSVAGVGEPFAIDVALRFARAFKDPALVAPTEASGAPSRVDVSIGLDDRLDPTGGRSATAAIANGAGRARIELAASRRGSAQLDRIWARWQGPLGLAWVQRSEALDDSIAIVPDIAPVRQEGVQLFLRDAQHGMIAQLDKGDGSDFDALTEFQAGMDIRAIDWKQSARHTRLLAKEFRTERNNHIVFAIDCGRTMCEPLGGLARLDRAVSAALLTAYVALKVGDRVSLFGFAARPRIASPTVSGARAFAPLQRAAAGLDYAAEETNYTLALTTLAAQLNRRALVIIFTDFADPTSAELMLRAVGRLLDRHLVLFVVLRDAELEDLATAEPADTMDVSRAVTASALLRERRIVVTRLKRLGAHVLEAPWNQVGTQLVQSYVDLKRRNLI